MAEKVVKHVSSEEARIGHNQIMAEMFHGFLHDNDLWPELKSWDYKTMYEMDSAQFDLMYGAWIEKKTTYAVEKLFQFAAMKGATREELVRIMAYILSIIDCGKYHLDIKHIKADLGIDALFKKYMTSQGRK